MATTNQGFKPVLVNDPEVIQYSKEVPVIVGASQVQYRRETTQGITPSQIRWTAVSPPSNTLISRKVSVSVPVRLTYTATGLDPTDYIINPSQFAIRSHPIMRACTNVSVEINSANLTNDARSSMPALEHFQYSNEMLGGETSLCPTYPAQAQNQEDMYLMNSSQCALNGSSTSQGARAGFPYQVVSQVNDGAGVGVSTCVSIVDFVSTEVLALSPIYSGVASQVNGAFANVEKLNLSLSFDSNSAALMALIDNKGFNGSGVAFPSVGFTASVQFSNFSTPFSYGTNVPEALFKHLQPNVQDQSELQSFYDYPYEQMNVQSTQGTSILAAASSTITTSSIKLSTVPHKIYLFLREQNVDQDAFSTDCFAAIDGVTLNFNNRDMLVQATKRQLYEMSVRNGCNIPWSQWSGEKLARGAQAPVFGTAADLYSGIGSVLCIDVVADLGLPMDMAPGSTIATQMQATIRYKNVSSDSRTYTAHLLYTVPGVLSLGEGQGVMQTGLYTPENVLVAKAQQSKFQYDWALMNAQRGGSAREKFAKFGSFLKSALPVLVKLLPLLAAGEDGGSVTAGGAVTAGSVVKKSTLRNRLR